MGERIAQILQHPIAVGNGAWMLPRADFRLEGLLSGLAVLLMKEGRGGADRREVAKPMRQIEDDPPLRDRLGNGLEDARLS